MRRSGWIDVGAGVARIVAHADSYRPIAVDVRGAHRIIAMSQASHKKALVLARGFFFARAYAARLPLARCAASAAEIGRPVIISM
ncbi:hypothetical protein D7S86_21930 [Pararobbsia silviterrae]|uniref:Uncharacterized protein n=1 Tax=Pararobbsia silviterrae TaxID=1792498 RepID=A0A494XFM0_9BURK|nr:hypothetical protein D7S86_21930 [Pararobbsia silviterrae]